MNGKLISLEGGDASGKSTNVPYLVSLLKEAGYDVVQTREPGGTPIGEEIRIMLLRKRESANITPMTELLLFAAMRSQHIEELIVPSIKLNKIVVCDRFTDSTYAYQGTGRGLMDEVMNLEDMVEAGLEPDHTLFFDITLEESKRRMALRKLTPDRLDAEHDLFKAYVHSGYLKRYKYNLHRMVRIDANKELSDVQQQIKKWVDEVFIPNNPLK